jgi:uncharacterized protein YdbL (DUF1318 family)
MRVEEKKENGRVGERMNGRRVEGTVRRKTDEGEYGQECEGIWE